MSAAIPDDTLDALERYARERSFSHPLDVIRLVEEVRRLKIEKNDAQEAASQQKSKETLKITNEEEDSELLMQYSWDGSPRVFFRIGEGRSEASLFLTIEDVKRVTNFLAIWLENRSKT